MPATAHDPIETYYESVLAMLRRVAAELCNDAGRARQSDVVQEVFLRLQPQLDRREAPESMVALASTIARRWLIDSTRKLHSELVDPVVLEAAREGVTRFLGVDLLDWNDYLDTLEPRERHVIDLRLFAGLSVEESAHCSNETVYFVRETLSSARRALERLQRNTPR